jgi:hypothetical protein
MTQDEVMKVAIAVATTTLPLGPIPVALAVGGVVLGGYIVMTLERRSDGNRQELAGSRQLKSVN